MSAYDNMWNADGYFDRIEAYFDYLDSSYFELVYTTVLNAVTPSYSGVDSAKAAGYSGVTIPSATYLAVADVATTTYSTVSDASSTTFKIC